jgi:two-component system, NarL family, invasion response regulator UvrY
MHKTTIVVIDDHKLVREMWKALFYPQPEIEIVGESGTVNEGIDIIRAKRPMIVLLDINLAQSSGFDAVPLIRKYAPGTKVIAVSMHSQPAYVKKMLSLGAKGYVTKNSSPDEILKAIAEVMQGGSYICSDIKNILSDQVFHNDQAGPDLRMLSLREIEIIKFLKEGLSSKEIAEKLCISPRTAEVHRHNVLKKLQLKNTAALINFINNSDLNL